jgi:phosphoglycolate phosphatase
VAIDAVLFDLDGTLVDSLADIAAAMNHALAAHGRPPHGADRYRAAIGGGAVDLVAKLVAAPEPGLRDAVLRGFRARYDAHLVVATAPYPGVVAMLDALAARRVPLAIVSNKPEAWTARMAEAIFPGRFAAVLGQSSARPAKPHPAMLLAAAGALGVAAARCAYVGDTGIDLAAARAAAMLPVGVRWGFRPDELAGAHTLDHPAELLDLLTLPRP